MIALPARTRLARYYARIEADILPRLREDEEDREKREAAIYWRWLKRPDPNPQASDDHSLRIGRRRYSPHWVLNYAHLRYQGVACMYTCAEYANESMYSHGCETHSVDDRRLDQRILWRAAQLRLAQRRAA